MMNLNIRCCRKILISSLFALIVSTCLGQFKKGVPFLGLDFNYSTSTTKYFYGGGTQASGDIKTNSFSVIPILGIFLGDHILVGLKSEWGREKNDDDVSNFYYNNIDNRRFAYGVFMRFYKMLGQAGFFFQGELTSSKAKGSYQVFNQQTGGFYREEDETSTLQAGVRPGVIFFITKKFALESTVGFIGYTRVKAENDPMNLSIDNNTNGFDFSLNPSNMNFGIRYYLIKD